MSRLAQRGPTMSRPIWKGVITFGMVSIPVKLFPATESKDVAMHLLHKDCNTRLKQLRWCPACEREVPWPEVVRGYEHARDQYVVLSAEELEKLPVPGKNAIQLEAFVESSKIDPVYFEKSYYLEPDGPAVKPFALLMRAMKDKDRAAVGRIAIRERERLCALRLMGGNLVLETLFYSDEVRLAPESALPAGEVPEREMSMALTLVDLMSEEFDPSKYQDTRRNALAELVEAKLQGQEVVQPAATPATKVVDLMEALRASVEAAKKRQGKAAPSGARPKRVRAA